MSNKTQEKEEGTLTISEIVNIQENLRKDIDFDKPEDQMTPEELAKKAIHDAMDKVVEDNLGKEKKKDIDEMRDKVRALKVMSENSKKLGELGKEIERNFITQHSYLVVYFDKKHPENIFHKFIDATTTSMVDKTENLSSSQRVEMARKILNVVESYREKMLGDLKAKQEILTALLPAFESLYEKTDYDLYEKEVEKFDGQDMRSRNKEWIELSKKLIKLRKKAIDAVEEDLSMEEILPKSVIESNGDVSQNVSASDMFTKGERIIRLTQEADSGEKEIAKTKDPLSESLFGKPETYMDFKNEESSSPAQMPATKSSSMKGTYILLAIVGFLYLVEAMSGMTAIVIIAIFFVIRHFSLQERKLAEK